MILRLGGFYVMSLRFLLKEYIQDHDYVGNSLKWQHVKTIICQIITEILPQMCGKVI